MDMIIDIKQMGEEFDKIVEKIGEDGEYERLDYSDVGEIYETTDKLIYSYQQLIKSEELKLAIEALEKLKMVYELTNPDEAKKVERSIQMFQKIQTGSWIL